MKKKIMPPTYFIVFLILSILLHFIFPIKKIIFVPYSYFGWLFILIGTILNIWADFVFKKSKTTVKPYEIPTSFQTIGPFCISRHPMYLGMMLVLLGVGIIHGTLVSFIFPIIFIIIMEKLFIPIEEKNLEKKFGNKYTNYKKRVGRWI